MGSWIVKHTTAFDGGDAHDEDCVTDISGSVKAVEKLLNYRFKDKRLLEDALTHSSYTYSASYERLEFLGDAALGLAVSNFVYLAYRDFGPGQLSLLRSANTSTEKFARVAVRHGLHCYVRLNATALVEKVRDFASAVEEEDDTVLYGGEVKAPKVLADLVESVAGAVYVDCKFDLQALWEIFTSLLEPIVGPEILQKQPHPVTTLFELCKKDHRQVKIEHESVGKRYIASVYVDEKLIASASSEQKETAKVLAAREALGKLFLPDSNAKMDVDYKCIEGTTEIEGAKQILNEVCVKKRWPKPQYQIEKDYGPSHDKRYICSVKIETVDDIMIVKGDEKSRVKDAENSAASLMIRELQGSSWLLPSRKGTGRSLWAWARPAVVILKALFYLCFALCCLVFVVGGFIEAGK